MGKPEKKQQKIICILGITGAVYGTFRYLLPLVIPFLLAWGLAVALRRSSMWIARHCGITVCGRKIGVPVGFAGVLQLALILTVLLAAVYIGGRKLCAESALLISRIPVWTEALDIWLTSACHRVEDGLNLRADVLVVLMREMLRGLMISVRNAAMPYLMVNSVTIFRWGAGGLILTLVTFIATGLSLQEMAWWKNRCSRSVFSREYALIARRLAVVGNAYLKTQGIIMLLTSLICTAGFWLLGNPYYILAGISLGLLDALPILGTGTVLIPWAVFALACRRWKQAALLAGLYVICYVVREVLEARLMANRVGLSPLETLTAMYVGLELFGIAGFLLGPVGLLLIVDLVNFWEEEQRQ